MCRGSLWCAKRFTLQATTKMPQQGTAINKLDTDYSSSLTVELSCRHSSTNASFNTEDGSSRKISDGERAAQNGSFMTRKDDTLVKAGIKISLVATIGSDQKGYEIYNSMSNFKLSKSLAIPRSERTSLLSAASVGCFQIIT